MIAYHEWSVDLQTWQRKENSMIDMPYARLVIDGVPGTPIDTKTMTWVKTPIAKEPTDAR